MSEQEKAEDNKEKQDPVQEEGHEKEDEEEDEESSEDSDAVEAEHLHVNGVDYGLLPNGDVYTEDGEYAGKWDPKKQKIMEEHEISHEHRSLILMNLSK